MSIKKDIRVPYTGKRVSRWHCALCVLVGVLWCGATVSFGQVGYPSVVDSLDIGSYEQGRMHRVWLRLGEDAMGTDVTVPVLIWRGLEEGPVLGLTAAIHGNELNGIGVIHKLKDSLDPRRMKGSIVAIPGLNREGLHRFQREYLDGTDLNRIFPGKSTGDRAQQMVAAIHAKVLPLMDYLVDMHTASFGRENSYYVRAGLAHDTLAMMARALGGDIILDNAGVPSFGAARSTMTMRAASLKHGAYAVTAEYGNPQVYQPDLVARGAEGILRLMHGLGMYEYAEAAAVEEAMVCKRSFWLYSDRGGLLEVQVALAQKVMEGERIAVLKDPFGTVVAEYRAPEDGVVIGRSSNPVCHSGCRLIHLGILAD